MSKTTLFSRKRNIKSLYKQNILSKKLFLENCDKNLLENLNVLTFKNNENNEYTEEFDEKNFKFINYISNNNDFNIVELFEYTSSLTCDEEKQKLIAVKKISRISPSVSFEKRLEMTTLLLKHLNEYRNQDTHSSLSKIYGICTSENLNGELEIWICSEFAKTNGEILSESLMDQPIAIRDRILTLIIGKTIDAVRELISKENLTERYPIQPKHILLFNDSVKFTNYNCKEVNYLTSHEEFDKLRLIFTPPEQVYVYSNQNIEKQLIWGLGIIAHMLALNYPPYFKNKTESEGTTASNIIVLQSKITSLTTEELIENMKQTSLSNTFIDFIAKCCQPDKSLRLDKDSILETDLYKQYKELCGTQIDSIFNEMNELTENFLVKNPDLDVLNTANLKPFKIGV